MPVWPEASTAAGYRTAAIGKMHFHPWDARLGFVERISAEDKRQYFWPDDYQKFLHANGMEKHHPTALPGYFEHLQASVFPHPKRFHVDGYVGDQAADWLRRHGGAGRQPFAAWVSFPGPHDPYDPPEELAAMYYDAPIPEPIPEPAAGAVPAAQRQGRRFARESLLYQLDFSDVTVEHYRRWRAHYYANITLIDEGIGKILAALEETGTLDDTLIVFTSDHGDALGDHGLIYKSFFYEPIAHIPLLARGPGVAAGARCRSLISTLDLVPLVLRHLRRPGPADGAGDRPDAPALEPGGDAARVRLQRAAGAGDGAGRPLEVRALPGRQRRAVRPPGGPDGGEQPGRRSGAGAAGGAHARAAG